MAAAPRPNKWATKVAYGVIGTPANLQSKTSKKQKKANKKLVSDELSFVR